MKGFFRHIATLLLIVIAMGLVGCNGTEKRPKPDPLEIVSIDKVEGSLGSKWVVTATIANNTAFNLRIVSGNIYIKDEDRKVVSIYTDDHVILPRRKHTQVTIPFNATISRSRSTLTALSNLRKGALSKINIDYSATVKALGSKFVVKDENLSLEQLNKDFNLGLK